MQPVEWRRTTRCTARACRLTPACLAAPCGQRPAENATTASACGGARPERGPEPANPGVGRSNIGAAYKPSPKASMARLQTQRMRIATYGRPLEHNAGFQCTMWPSKAPSSWSDARRCAEGNRLDDGFEYVTNRGRGTKNAACAGPCACCRRRRRVSAQRARLEQDVMPLDDGHDTDHSVVTVRRRYR